MTKKKKKTSKVVIYFSEKEKVHELLERVAKKYEPYEILINRFGKPYVKDDKFFYSISHNGKVSALVVSDDPIGIDLEDIHRNSKHSSILYHMTIFESTEILTNKDFLLNWTAREAFAKYVGTSVYVIFKDIEYYHGNMTCYFKPTGAFIKHFQTNYGLIAIAQENERMKFEFIDMIKNPDTKVPFEFN